MATILLVLLPLRGKFSALSPLNLGELYDYFEQQTMAEVMLRPHSTLLSAGVNVITLG